MSYLLFVFQTSLMQLIKLIISAIGSFINISVFKQHLVFRTARSIYLYGISAFHFYLKKAVIANEVVGTLISVHKLYLVYDTHKLISLFIAQLFFHPQ